MSMEAWLVGIFAGLAAIGLLLMDQRRAVLSDLGAIIAMVALAIVIMIVMLLPISPAPAHDHNRPELNDWFKSLKSPGHGYCCDGSDALSIDDPDWENDSGHYRVRLEGQWVDVPDDAVIDEPNRAGHALVWPYRSDGVLNRVRCFLPGTMG